MLLRWIGIAAIRYQAGYDALTQRSLHVNPSALIRRARWPAGRRGSALARRVPLRGGRNARPVSPGPSGPTRGQAGAPAAAGPPLGRLRWPASRRGGTTLTPALVGPDGIPAG